MDPEIELDLLGSMSIRSGGEERSLPSSRKTRALLAYLGVNKRPERRERLCDLFWQVPDDPRGALRWSLSKLRPLVDSQETKRLKADREFVQLEIADESIDWWRLKRVVSAGAAEATTEVLRRVVREADVFLEGLDLSGCEEFNAWCIAQREDVRQWRITLLDEVTGRALEVEEAVSFARSWTMLDPLSARPWERLVQLLEHSERTHESEQQRALAVKVLAEAGLPIPQSLRRPGQGEPIRSAVGSRLAPLEQKISFCRSSDGTGIAYSQIGEGDPLVRAGYWMNHLETDWTSPIWRPWIERFSSDHSLVRYDTRGMGLSDRDVEQNIDLYVDDLGAVVDAAELDRFDLYGMAQGAVTATVYTARNPHRVRRLILQSSYAQGWKRRNDTQEIERRKAMITLATSGWSKNSQALRHMFAGLYMPSGDEDQCGWFDRFFQSMMAHRDIEKIQNLLGEVDIRNLAEQVASPTLIIHSRGEMVIPVNAGREMATLIRDARLVTLDTSSHLVVPGDPSWPSMIDVIEEFLDEA